MPGIICAVRGGPNSQNTVDQALELALQTHLPLTFLYVINMEFLSRTITNRVQVARDQIQKMGEFFLLTAQERAAQRGISPVQTAIREGKVSDEIIELCNQVQADYVVLGSPAEGDENSLFAGERLQTFLTKLETECHAGIVLARRDS